MKSFLKLLLCLPACAVLAINPGDLIYNIKNTGNGATAAGLTPSTSTDLLAFDGGGALTRVARSSFVSTSGAYADPAWITSLPWSKISGAPSFLTSNQAITLSGAVTGTGSTSIVTSLTSSSVRDALSGGSGTLDLSSYTLSLANPVRIGDGTNNAPTLAFASALTTGIHKSWSGGIGFGVGGVFIANLDSDGLTLARKSLKFEGTSSGSITFTPPAAAGSQVYTLPTAVPASNGQALVATTGGVMSWTSFAPVSHEHDYLPLTGGTLSGNLTTTGSLNFGGGSYSGNLFERTLTITHSGGRTASFFFPNLASGSGNRTYILPDNLTASTQTLVTSADTGSVTNTMLAGSIANDKLANSSITINGSAVSLGGSTTISTGLTIDTTAITGGTSGRLLTSGTTVGELTLGSGVSTALVNATDAASGLLTYGIIGTSGAKLPLLNGANTWSAAQSGTDWTSSGRFYGASGAGYPQFTVSGASGYGMRVTSARLDFWIAGGVYMVLVNGGIGPALDVSGIKLAWGSNVALNGGSNGGGRLVQQVGSTAQAYSIANTYTSFTVKEEVELGWTSNVAHLWTLKGSGGGTARDLVLGFDSTEKMRVSTSGVAIGTTGSAIASIKRSSVTLVAGTATVSDTATTANSVVLMSVLTPGGTVGALDYDVSAGSSYTINSSSATDTSTINITVIHYP